MKKVIMSLICMLLSIGVSPSAFAASIEADHPDDQAYRLREQIYQAEQAMALQDDALDACALFDSNLAVDDEGQLIYPDSYAGRYIDDNGHLIIQIASSDLTPPMNTCAKYIQLSNLTKLIILKNI